MGTQEGPLAFARVYRHGDPPVSWPWYLYDVNDESFQKEFARITLETQITVARAVADGLENLKAAIDKR